MPLEADPNAPVSEEQKSGSLLTSMGKAVGVGAIQDVVAPALEMVGDFGSDDETSPWKVGAKIARKAGRAVEETIPEEHRRAGEASFFPDREKGQAGVFDAPGTALAMQGARIVPTIAALVGLKRIPTQAAAGAIQGGGQFLNETANEIEKQTDEQLEQTNPEFAKLVAQGMPSDLARKLAIKKAQETPGAQTVEMIGGGVGAGFVGHALRGAAGRSFKGAVGVGAAEGATGVAAGSGSASVGQQLAEIEIGKRSEIDWGEVARATADGAAKGVLLGGTMGAAGGVGAARERARAGLPPVAEVPRVETKGIEDGLEGNAPSAAETAALAAAEAPVEGSPASRASATAAGVVPPEAPVAPAVRPRSIDEAVAAKEAELAAAAEQPAVVQPAPLPAQGVQAIVPPAANLATPVQASQAAPAAASPGIEGSVAAGITPGGNAPFDLRGRLHALAPKNTQFTKIRDGINAQLTEAGQKPMTDAQVRAVLKEGVDAGEIVYSQKRGYRSKRSELSAPVRQEIAQVDAPALIDPTRPTEGATPVERRPGTIEPQVLGAERGTVDPTVGAKSDTPTPGPVVATLAAGDTGATASVPPATPARPVAPAKPATAKSVPEVRRPTETASGLKIGEKIVTKGPPPAPVEVVQQVVAATGGSPTSSTTQKVARRVAKVKKTAEERAAEQAKLEAEANALLAKQGKPRVLKAKPTAETEATKTKAAVVEAQAEVRARDAERKRASRAKAHGANDEKARKVVEGFWEGDDTNAVDQRAAAGDIKAVGDVINRAKRVALVAEDEGVVLRDTRTGEGFGRATHTKADKENKNVTPWVNFVRQSAIYQQVASAILRGKMTPEKQQKLADYTRDYVTAEHALRHGDFEKAAEGRVRANEEKTAKHAEAKRGETNDPDFDKKSMADVQAQHADVENAMVDLIDGKVDRLLPKIPGRGEPNPKIEGAISAPEGPISGELSTGHSAPKHVWDAINKSPVKTFAEVIRENIKSVKGDGPEARLVRSVAKRLVNLVGNAKVVWLDDATMNDRWANAAGVYLHPTDANFGRGHNGAIVLNGDHATLHVVMHEAVHAATTRELEINDKMRHDVLKLLNEVRRQWGGDPKEYGLRNEHEFLAEAMTNPDFQKALLAIELPQPIATRWGAVKNAWDALVRKVAQYLGFTEMRQVNALDAAMRAFEETADNSDASRTEIALNNFQALDEPQFIKINAVKKWVAEGWEERKGAGSEYKHRMQRTLDKVATFTQLGNTSDALFGANKPARRLAELMGKMSTTRDAIIREDAPLVRDLFRAGRLNPEGMAKLEDFLIDETSAGVFGDRPLADQKHIAKDGPSGWTAKANYARVKAAYDALPPEMKALRTRLHEYFKTRQDQMSLGLINNVLKAMSEDGKGSPALAKRIHENKLTDADKAFLGGDAAFATIQRAGALAKIAGPYVPLMRRGDFVVQGRLHVDTPAGARRMTEDETLSSTGRVFEFKTEAETKAFLQRLADKEGVSAEAQRVYVDPQTGSNKYEADIDGKKVIKTLNKEETNAEERYRVTIQDKHVEFHERERDAAKAREELIKRGVKDVADLDLRKLNAAAAGANFMPTQIEAMINALTKRTSFKNLHKGAQDELIRHLHEMGIAAMSSTRAQTRRLPRTNVAGASNDITTNTQQYSSSTAGYLSRLQHQPNVDATLKEMQAFAEDSRYSGNGDDTQLRRRARLQEFERRVYDMRDPEPAGLFNRAVSRLLQISYLDKLASPAFHIINSMEPWTVSFPVIAGRHGMAALAAIQKAYTSIGGGRAIAAGLGDTLRAYKSDDGLTDYASLIKDRLNGQADGKDLGSLIDHLHDVGLLSRDAGMELSRVIRPDAHMVGRALDRADLMARQMGTAIESINRTVTAVAAYRLERAKGAGHDAALKYATEVVHDSMGDYNSWNAAPIFNHPIGRLALQFRKYAQKTYYLLGKQALASLKGDTQAMKAFAGLMGTHMLVAGSLGLPLEAIKIGMLAAGVLGITERKYSDLEQNVREGAAAILGKNGGQIFTRGLPRWLGVDLAGRMGLDSLFMGQIDPKSLKPDDMYAYLARNFAGAPISYIMDASQGFQKLAAGDVLEATRLITPLKIYADSVQAYQLHEEGRKSATGRQLVKPITAGQAITKMLGFTPGDIAEGTEQSFAIRGDQQVRKDQRNKLIADYVGGSDKGAVLRRINEWNKNQPDNAKIEFKHLSGAEKRRREEERSGTYDSGVRYTARDKDLKEANSFYNL